jgi:GntR family transcriptional repressor for pyruvate dehydrogenase complex
MFKPIQPKTASSSVADQIKEMILQGHLQPGDRLPSERDFAETFGVSRATIREALRSLSAIGMISIRQGDGSFVEQFKIEGLLEPLATLFQLDGAEDELESFSEVREILEVEMVALAAERASETDIENINRALEAMVEEVRSGGIGDVADADFHLAIAKSCKNPLLVKLMEVVANLMKCTYQASRKQLFLDQKSLAEIYNTHHDVLKAIETRNPKEAKKRMRNHLRQVNQKLKELKSQPRELG